MMSLVEKVKYLASLIKDVAPIMRKYSKLSIQEFAGKFTHPAL